MNFLDNILEIQSHIIGHKNHIIQDIFRDHRENFLISNHSLDIRPVVKDEISKFLLCGSMSSGYSVYDCNACAIMLMFLLLANLDSVLLVALTLVFLALILCPLVVLI